LRGRHSIRGSSSSTRRRPSVDTETELLIRDATAGAGGGPHDDRRRAPAVHDPGHGPKPRVPQGQLREAGTHQELLAEHGIYFKLFELQYKSANLVSKSA
jgi:ATP-binding cassette subfamily B protein